MYIIFLYEIILHFLQAKDRDMKKEKKRSNIGKMYNVSKSG